MRLTPDVLQGRFVRLEPLEPDLREDVRAALDTDADAWAIMVNNGGGEAFAGWWDASLASMASGSPAYAVRRLSDGAVVGTTAFHDFHPQHRRTEVGSTFYRPDARSGPVNPECKFLMLRHAFDSGMVRVELITDAINARSRAAILKLGAVQEGVLRRHKTTWTGRVRDTVMFSITDQDWPSVRERLERRLASFA